MLLKGWNYAREMSKQKSDQWALFAKSFLDRTRLALSSKAEYYHQILQPSAEYLGSLLGIDEGAVCLLQTCTKECNMLKFTNIDVVLQVSIFTEEIIRAGSAASLSTLLNRLDPVLRRVAHLGRLLIDFFFTYQ